MSNVNELRVAMGAKDLKLHEVHPLAQESHESRLRYLSAVAWALGLDCEPSVLAQDAFVALANSLSVDAEDAGELLAERSNVTGADLNIMLEKARTQLSLYILDFCWLMSVDHSKGDAENRLIKVFSEQVGAKVNDVVRMFNFVKILRTGGADESITASGLSGFFSFAWLVSEDSKILMACYESIARRVVEVSYSNILLTHAADTLEFAKVELYFGKSCTWKHKVESLCCSSYDEVFVDKKLAVIQMYGENWLLGITSDMLSDLGVSRKAPESRKSIGSPTEILSPVNGVVIGTYVAESDYINHGDVIVKIIRRDVDGK